MGPALRWRELRWPSDADIAALRELAQTAVDAWRAAWEVPGLRLTSVWRAWEAPAVRIPQAWRPFAVDQAGTTAAWVEGDELLQLRALAACLFQCSPLTSGPYAAEASGIAYAVSREALGALLSGVAEALRLQPADAIPDQSLSAMPPATDHHAWSGAVQAHVAWGPDPGGSARLHLGAGALGTLLHRTPARADLLPRPALREMSVALAARPLQLRALLDDTPLEIGHLLSLQPGDVLVTPHRLSDPLRVVARPADAASPFAPITSAQLGRRGGRMALAFGPRVPASMPTPPQRSPLIPTSSPPPTPFARRTV